MYPGLEVYSAHGGNFGFHSLMCKVVRILIGAVEST